MMQSNFACSPLEVGLHLKQNIDEEPVDPGIYKNMVRHFDLGRCVK